MHLIAVFLIVSGCLFNCCAVVLLLVEKRKTDLSRKAFQKHLADIDYHLHRARRLGRAAIDELSLRRNG